MTSTERLNLYSSLMNEHLPTLFSYEKDSEQAVLFEAMNYSLSAGGKRIRPVLVFEFCRILGGEYEKALPFASAIEMIHTYSLIHDDLPCMDDDDFRRGKPSCHKQFGEANALLAGDALLTSAFTVLTEGKDLSSEQIAKACRTLSSSAGACGMVSGQLIDLYYEDRPITADRLLEMYRLKTCELIKAACLLGVIAANGGDREMKIAAEYAENLGLAFQIIDDILDVVGDEKEIGKPVGSDAERNKETFVTIYGLEQAKEIAETYTNRALALLEELPDHEFLVDLTKMLLNRNH